MHFVRIITLVFCSFALLSTVESPLSAGTGKPSKIPAAVQSDETVLYVAKNGDDASAVPGRLDKAFRSIGSAVANASKGNLVYLLPGHYTEGTSLGTNTINYFMLPGVTIDYAGKALTNLIDDALHPRGINVAIDGFADFANHSSYHDSENYPALIQITNPLSHLDLRCRDMFLRETQTGSINILNCSHVNIDAQRMIGGDNSVGVYWRDGSGIHIKAKEVRTGAYALWEDSSKTNTVQDMFADVDYIETGDEGGIYVSGQNPNSALWVESKLMKFDSVTGVHLIGVSKLYASAQKFWITRTNGALFYVANTGRFWGDGNKATSAGAPFLLTTDGFVDLTIQQYEESGGTVDVGFDLGGGAVHIHGGRMDITGTCLRHTGGTNVIKDISLDSSRGSTSPVLVTAPGLTLQNCTLIAPPGVPSISATNAQTVRIIGTLTVNSKPDPRITFIGGRIDLQN